MHCPSCVSTIRSILEFHLPTPEQQEERSRADLEMGRSRPATSHSARSIGNIDISLLNGLVSFDHSLDLDLTPIFIELRDSGFEVSPAEPSTRVSPPVHSHSPTWWNLLPNRLGKEQRRKHKQFCEACQTEPSIDSRVPAKGKAPAEDWRESTFSVSGMTCRYVFLSPKSLRQF
jgi:hypothetical protein